MAMPTIRSRRSSVNLPYRGTHGDCDSMGVSVSDRAVFAYGVADPLINGVLRINLCHLPE